MHNSVVGLASAQRMESPSPGALFLCDSIFSLEDVARMRAASHTTDRKQILSKAMSLNKLWPLECAADGIHNRKRHDVILEIFVHTWNFAQSQELSDEKVSTLLALVYDLISWTCLRNASQPTMEESYAHFETELLRHSVQNIPQSLSIFTLPEVRAIATFVLRFYLRHLSMYQYVLGTTRLLQIIPVRNVAQGIEVYSQEEELNLTRIRGHCQSKGSNNFAPSALLLPLSTAKAYIQSEAFGCTNADSSLKCEQTQREQLYPDSYHFIEEPDSKDTIADALARFPVITHQVLLPCPQTASSNTGSNSRPTSGTVLNSSSSIRPMSASSRPSSCERPKLSACSSRGVDASKIQVIPICAGAFTQGLKTPVFAGSSGFIKPSGFSSLPIYTKQKILSPDGSGNEIVSVHAELKLCEDRPTPIPLPTSRSVVLSDGTILQGSLPPEERLIKLVEDKVKGIVTSKLTEKSTLSSRSASSTPTAPAASPGLVARRLGQPHSVGVR